MGALATDKKTRSFGLLDQNETRFFTYVSKRAESNFQGSYCHNERLAVRMYLKSVESSRTTSWLTSVVFLCEALFDFGHRELH